VTDKFMRKLVWTGSKLSVNEADGAWKSPYDIADIQIPGIVSRGSGTTPTLIGTGLGEDKLVAIADFGDPVKVVVFWADTIPADFKQKPGTKSRRIADQVSVRIGSRGTIESSFVGFGNGFVAYNQTPLHPVVEDGPAAAFTLMLTLGVTRPAPTGVEKFVWNKAERKLASV
jgi:hypothetical protein